MRLPTPGSWVGGLISAALLAAGLGALLLAWALPSERAQLAAANQPVNPGATDPTDIATHNSPAAAHNPTDPQNLVVANRVDGPQAGCAVHVSTDAGDSWTETAVPTPDDGQACFAPDVAFGPQGTLYVAYVSLTGLRNEPTAAWVATSTDGGASLSEPTQVTGEQLPFQVSVAADPSQPDRAYVAWLQASAAGPWGFPDTANPIRVARSDDTADTWSEPVTVNAAEHERALAPTVDVGPDGRVGVAYLDLADDALDYHGDHDGHGGPAFGGTWTLALTHSTNAGDSWNQSVVSDQLEPRRRLIAFFPPTPALALGKDRTHLAFHDARQSPADIWHWTRPTDNHEGFGAPTRVNDTDPDEDTTAQYLPQLALAPTGRVDVVYYDRRDDPDNVSNHVSLQSSHDHGTTFAPAVQLTDTAFDSRIGDGAERNLADLGSQLGLTATPDRATAVWTDTRAATQASHKQDLAHAHVAFTAAPTWRPILLVAGLLALAAGLLVTARWVTARRRNRARPPRARPRQPASS